ncbi:SEC-C domain-containing protein [Mycobacterium simiae]|uniref:SEC-C domain-containing protein n=1 Tax=Mycobacterium simiae TaxID=1784 RepID=A0A5B1BIB5_MYCSI|nr:SEC-C domain-containing protein [Mycobacterium simiae]
MAAAFGGFETLASILTEHGPLHQDDLVARLRDSGVANPDQVLDQIECLASQLVDDSWVWLPTVLAGRVFTHRLGADELAHDVLAITPDLDPIAELCRHERYQRLTDGSPLRVALAGFDHELLEQRGIPAEEVDPLGALLLASGTLAALGAAQGDLVGVRLTERGLAVERITEVVPAEDVGARLAATLDAEEPKYLGAAVWTLCADDPQLFTEPLPPLSEIVDDYGLERGGDLLAPGGFAFNTWRFDQGCMALAERYDLDADDAVALFSLLKLYDHISLLLDAADEKESPEEATAAAVDWMATPEFNRLVDLVAEFGDALVEPLLAELVVAETIDTDGAGTAALALFAVVLEPKVPRPARVACRWLRAVAMERIGDIEAAERDLLAAESMSPDWPLPLFDLARIASDRGDVERGLALLRRAGAEPDYPLAELLEQYRAEPRRDIGRNDLCWCGSGRKYKKCHLGREQLPLSDRARWLYAKAIQHALTSGWNDLLIGVADERSRHAGDDPEALTTALGDPLVIDVVLFEGGAFQKFLEVRGSLLPDDERLLAEQWLLAKRSVFEVQRVQRDHSVTVRDLRTDDTHEVREHAASCQLKPGQLVCARVLPAGDTTRFFGGAEPVELPERNPLIDLLDTQPDAVTLVAQLSRRFAPPAR